MWGRHLSQDTLPTCSQPASQRGCTFQPRVVRAGSETLAPVTLGITHLGNVPQGISLGRVSLRPYASQGKLIVVGWQEQA